MQQHSNEINLEQRGAITLFDIRGDLTSFSEPFLSDHFKKIFSMVGITRFAEIHETVENALEVMS
jgi:hypothetical protein